jgi:hypothetical protein
MIEAFLYGMVVGSILTMMGWTLGYASGRRAR